MKIKSFVRGSLNRNFSRLPIFFGTLDHFYIHGVFPGIYCKYYIRAKAFEYELYKQDGNIINFLEKADYTSEIFSFWNDAKERNSIILDIIKNAKILLNAK
jgi:hypothetical protein